MATDHPGPYLLLTLSRSGGWEGEREDIEPTLTRVEDADTLAGLYIDHADYDLTAGDIYIYDAADLSVIDPRQVAPLRARVEEHSRVMKMRNDAATREVELRQLRMLLAKYPDAKE